MVEITSNSRTLTTARFAWLALTLQILVILQPGCGSSTTTADHETMPDPPAEDVAMAPLAPEQPEDPLQKFQRELKARNPFLRLENMRAEEENGRIVRAEFENADLVDLSPLASTKLEALGIRNSLIQDLSPLKELPLKALYLEECQVKDLSPLANSSISTLWVTYAPLADIKPLEGLPLKELNLLGTQVKDITPLAKSPLEMLWLNETQVSEIAPLAELPLVSLTLHKTPVKDLSPLAKSTSLRRLHIGETAVEDLTPLAGMKLDRLIFTPEKIQSGLEVIRQMPSLKELDTQFGQTPLRTPAQFWAEANRP